MKEAIVVWPMASAQGDQASTCYSIETIPESPFELLAKFKGQEVSPKSYLDLALLYFYRGDHASYKKFIEAGCDAGILLMGSR